MEELLELKTFRSWKNDDIFHIIDHEKESLVIRHRPLFKWKINLNSPFENAIVSSLRRSIVGAGQVQGFVDWPARLHLRPQRNQEGILIQENQRYSFQILLVLSFTSPTLDCTANLHLQKRQRSLRGSHFKTTPKKICFLKNFNLLDKN